MSMPMPDLTKPWTRDAVLALPDDGNRYELLDGELLVSPSPRPIHQLAVCALYDRIRPYVGEYRLGLTCPAPADLDFRAGQLLQPDLFVIQREPGQSLLEWSGFGIPIWIAEVLSPSTAFSDRNRKRKYYLKAGVGEYWIVDCDARLIERWRPGDERPEILTERIEWQPAPAPEALVIDLAEYFREIWGDA